MNDASLALMIPTVVFLLTGLPCLLWPEQVLRFYLDLLRNHPTLPQPTLSLSPSRTKLFSFLLRILGVTLLGLAFYLLAELYRI